MVLSTKMEAFIIHSSADSEIVIQIAAHLRKSLDSVYYYEEFQRTDTTFVSEINSRLSACNIVIIVVGKDWDKKSWPQLEVDAALALHNKGQTKSFFVVPALDADGSTLPLPRGLNLIQAFPQIILHEGNYPARDYAASVAFEICRRLDRIWHSMDDLPVNPHMFDYEKDIIGFYMEKARLGESLYQEAPGERDQEWMAEMASRLKIREKLMHGCPVEWPSIERLTPHVMTEQKNKDDVNPLSEAQVGGFRNDRVVAAALGKYHPACREDGWDASGCMFTQNYCFNEAGPRQTHHFPFGNPLRAAILVSGGIAPGLNAVIDGIAQRHWMYATGANSCAFDLYGFRNGFRAFDNLQDAAVTLAHYNPAWPLSANTDPSHSSFHVDEGGCFLGTSRVDDLINSPNRLSLLKRFSRQLDLFGINILYVIGGDGSMKAAHALWSVARQLHRHGETNTELSVVAIPKTMDNDILWMWQTFGFLSAVEKAREFIESLYIEVSSNPRLCVLQLFGSDSGFVVSHAVLATASEHCDAALIPEVPFSMRRLAEHVQSRMLGRSGVNIPHGMVVMAETAIPVDALDYRDSVHIGLSNDEKTALDHFCEMRKKGMRIEGQTNDLLRSAGLKIVSRGLGQLMRTPLRPTVILPPAWQHLRVMTSEPRHLLRAIRPSTSDIIMGQRLGSLAVDNAMAGFTDFMVSQWLTEYVLVPLKLVVLGRKRIPRNGIFWKSVLAKTSQPQDM